MRPVLGWPVILMLEILGTIYERCYPWLEGGLWFRSVQHGYVAVKFVFRKFYVCFPSIKFMNTKDV